MHWILESLIFFESFIFFRCENKDKKMDGFSKHFENERTQMHASQQKVNLVLQCTNTIFI